MPRTTAPHHTLALALALAPLACAEDIGFDDEHDEHGEHDDESSDGDGDGDATSHEELGDGVTRTTVDASDEAAWIYLDLDGAAELPAGEPGWDLGFRRFEIILNGGISGDEGVELAIVDGVAFEDLAAVPDDAAWITDAADGDDEDMDPDLALFDWYDYDFMTHVLTPKDRVYLVRGSEDAVFKLQIADYYSSSGTSGHLQFYWAPLD